MFKEVVILTGLVLIASAVCAAGIIGGRILFIYVQHWLM